MRRIKRLTSSIEKIVKRRKPAISNGMQDKVFDFRLDRFVWIRGVNNG